MTGTHSGTSPLHSPSVRHASSGDPSISYPVQNVDWLDTLGLYDLGLDRDPSNNGILARNCHSFRPQPG